MLRVLHTSDWHLGHVLHDVNREHEHAHFLQWLLTQLEEHAVDALLIAGDVFDTANPPAEAQRSLFAFLASARERLPRLQVVLIAGNHDSPARIDAPEPLLSALGVHVVGALPRLDEEGWESRLVVPLTDTSGAVAAWVAAVPFLRSSDLPAVADASGEKDPLVEGVRRVYETVLAAARARRQSNQALIGMGHLYLTGTRLSELSERKVLGGNQHALPHDLFPEDVTYAALGHLHLAQEVARASIRYSGSPIPLALSEASYRHQVCLLDFNQGALGDVRSLEVPRLVHILRVPASGAAPLPEVLRALESFPSHQLETPPAAHLRPFLEVCIRLDAPDATLRQKLERALEGKRPRLVRIGIEWTGTGAALAETETTVDLRDLSPEDVFIRRYQRDHEGRPSAELLSAFHELLDGVRQEEGR